MLRMRLCRNEVWELRTCEIFRSLMTTNVITFVLWVIATEVVPCSLRCWTFACAWCYKTFSCSTLMSMKFILLIDIKMPFWYLIAEQISYAALLSEKNNPIIGILTSELSMKTSYITSGPDVCDHCVSMVVKVGMYSVVYDCYSLYLSYLSWVRRKLGCLKKMHHYISENFIDINWQNPYTTFAFDW